MKKEITFTAKQVGERVKERRTELNLTMPELGKRIGVNKSTIQRYEQRRQREENNDYQWTYGGTTHSPNGSQVFQKIRNMSRTLCEKDWKNISKSTLILYTVVNGEPHQQLLTTFLGKMIDLYSVLCHHFLRCYDRG